MRTMFTVFVMFKKSTEYTEDIVHILAKYHKAKHIGSGTMLTTGVRDMQFEFEGPNARRRCARFVGGVKSLKFVNRTKIVEELYSHNG